MTAPRKRLSVSAIRDYQKCGRFYFYKRVRKLPDPMSHHAPAGTLVHNSFYAAYGTPLLQPDLNSDRMKTVWYVTGRFDAHMAMAIFDLFWNRRKKTETFDELLAHVTDDRYSEPSLREQLEQFFLALQGEMPIVNNFRAGQLVALGKGKNFNQAELHAGWGKYYRDMLAGIVAKPLPYPVKEIEREVFWKQGDVNMVGYLDIVMDASSKYGPDAEIGTDLKTAYNKPSEKELVIEDQMLGYYDASEKNGSDMRSFSYWHLRSNTMYPVKDDPDLRALLNHTATQVGNKIHEGDWTPRFDKENCAMCTYLKQCKKEPLLGSGPFEYTQADQPLAEPPAPEYVPVLF